MLKKIMNRLARAILIVTYIAFIIGTISFAVLFFIKLKQYNDLNDLYSQAQTNLNKNSKESQVTIGSLQQSFNDLNNEVSQLKQKNSDLQATMDKQSKEGYGEIDGKVSGQIVLGENNLSQYQMVCAENINNRSLQYCVSVSAISQNYALIVPAGTYQVYARVLDKDNKLAMPNYKASYSEYVKCVVEKSADQCDPKLSKTIINIEVKAGEKAVNINPIDWNTTNG